MVDSTYHFEPGNEMILGSHMLEICPTISATKPKIVVHPLGIGGKADPARLVFNGDSGSAVVASLVELGGRYRLIVNEVKAEQPLEETPQLPVAKVDRKSTRLNSSHVAISYAVFCLKKKRK